MRSQLAGLVKLDMGRVPQLHFAEGALDDVGRAHLLPVSFGNGEKLKQGQLIGQIGTSGDSLGPHLYYTVVDSPHYPGQGLPSYFRDFRRILGSRSEDVCRGEVDTGDLVERLR